MPTHHMSWRSAWPWLLGVIVLGAAGLLAAFVRQPSAAPKPTPAIVAQLGTTEADSLQTNTVVVPSPTTTAPPPTDTPVPTATATATATATPPPTDTPMPTDTPAPTSTPEPPSLTITADLLRVRAGPGTAYGTAGSVRAGETFTVLAKSEDGKWWQVELPGTKGWVSGEYVHVTGAVEEVTVAKVAPPPTAQPQQPAAAAGAAPIEAASAPAPKPASAGFFARGIQIDPGGDLGATIGAVKGLGMNWVKFQLPWKNFEGTQGVRNFPDDIVNGLNGNGINILASIVKAPEWARPGGTNLSVEGPPGNPQDYASFVGEFAARYCGRVQAIEVWNEQNLWYEWGGEALDARRYIQLLAAAYRAIKASCPGMIVVSGAPTPTGATPPWAIRDTTYLEQMYQAGLKRYSDAIGVHPSGYGNPPDVRVQDFQAGNYSRPSHVNDSSFYFRNTMEQYRNIMVKYGDGNKRLWPTEFGWASSSSPVAGYEYAAYNSERDQAAYIAKAFDMMSNWGFVGVAFLWNLNYNVTQPGTELAAFGIQGRPAYDALRP
jgi:hypothetical protein